MMKPYKNRIIDYNAPVEIYRCLNRKGVVYSIRQFNKVVAHTDYFILKDCEFIVNQSGLNYVRQHKKKIVHAYIKGYLTNNVDDILLQFSYIVRYNPYILDSFYITHTYKVYKSVTAYTQDNNILIQL